MGTIVTPGTPPSNTPRRTPAVEPDLCLFDAPPRPTPEPERLSADRRRTERRRRQLAQGIHPRTGQKARPDLGTCGDCAYIAHNERGFLKCTRFTVTHGPATDVRASWPGCHEHEYAHNPAKGDAARWTPAEPR